MKQALPLVGHLSEKNKKLIYDNVKPVCFVFYDVDAELKSRKSLSTGKTLLSNGVSTFHFPP